MKTYIFNQTDSGYIGKAFEMAIKDALCRKNPDKVSPCGKADFRYNRKNYDVKQNGSVIQYSPDSNYIAGSNRVIYAVHVAANVAMLEDAKIAVSIDLFDTDFHCVDKKAFIDFLEDIGQVKANVSRGTVNIQTMYNYKKDAYHGKKGYTVEEWMEENALDDPIIDAILDGITE